MDDIEKRCALIQSLGFTMNRAVDKVVEFNNAKGETFYLMKTRRIRVVVSPARMRAGVNVSGVSGKDAYNGNFAAFPRKLNKGKRPEKYGIAFDAKDDSHMKKIISEALGV